MLRGLKDTFTSKGWEVLTAPDGQSGLETSLSADPDLILLDLGLPDCDGLDVCRRLKEEERFRWIPVIMLTGRSTVVDKITGLEVGADDYLTKPCDPGELVARIRAVLRRKQALGPVTDYDKGGLKISADRRQVDVTLDAFHHYDVQVMLLGTKPWRKKISLKPPQTDVTAKLSVIHEQ